LGEGRDISERKKAEEALKKSEVFLNKLLNSIPIPVFYKNRDGQYVEFNKTFETFFGTTKEYLIGKTVLDINPPELAKICRTKDNELFESGGEQHYESQVKNTFGVTRDVIFSKAALTDSKGTISGLIGTIYDITERKQAEKALLESEERYRFITDHTADHIWTMDLSMHFTYSSPSVIKTIGYTVDEFMAQTIDHIFTPESLVVAGKLLVEELKKDKDPKADPNRIRTFQSEHYHKNGTLVWMESSLIFIRDASMKPISILGVSRDITERKKSEEVLRQSEEKYRTILENIEEGYYEVNLAGNYTFVNDSLCIIHGYSKDELMGMNYRQYTDIENAKIIFEAFNQLYETGEPFKGFDWQIIRKDGTKRYIEQSASLKKDPTGTPIGFRGITRDITERKMAEEALRKSEHRYLELSIIDDLTQLYNSRHFYAQLEREIERSNRYEQPLTLMMLDLDKFKMFNDTYGHVEGDYVLSKLGQVIKQCLRETDSAYRYGGEEFTIMLPMTTSDEGLVTAQRIQAELRKEYFSPVLDQKINMTVSIGLSQYKLKEEIKAFVNRVDKLMYQAKKNGRNRICSES
jgi:diguanylate cyclase (GGDEF)-like protein/PAS domain S-box-containing protein